MPYKNIVFAKLEKRLLNDPRWFGMSENAQLNFIKLILIASETYNKIPRSLDLLCSLLRTKQRRSTILKTLKEIELNFPKFKKNENFYYFEDFHEKTNYVRAIPRNAPGTPKEVTDKEKEKYIDKEKEREREDLPLSTNNFLEIPEEIKKLWITTWGRIPKIPEQEETEKLIEKFGIKKLHSIFKSASLKGFQNLDTLINALDEQGNIKPKENNNGRNGNQQRRKDYVTKDEYERGIKNLYEGRT